MKMVARLERMAFPRLYRILYGTFFAWCFFLAASSAKAEPSYGEVLAGVMQSLGGGTSVIEMKFEAYPSGEFEGRVNVVGTYSFGQDFYSFPKKATSTYAKLQSIHGISEQEVAEYFKDVGEPNSLNEVSVTYPSGYPLKFKGDLYYKSVVGGVQVVPGHLDKEIPVGSKSIQGRALLVGSSEESLIIEKIATWKRRRGPIVDLRSTKSDTETVVVYGVRSDEFITVYLPHLSGRSNCKVVWFLADDWKKNNGEKVWLVGPDPQMLEKVEGGAGLIRKYAFLPEVQRGMQSENLTLDLAFSSPCKE